MAGLISTNDAEIGRIVELLFRVSTSDGIDNEKIKTLFEQIAKLDENFFSKLVQMSKDDALKRGVDEASLVGKKSQFPLDKVKQAILLNLQNLIKKVRMATSRGGSGKSRKTKKRSQKKKRSKKRSKKNNKRK